MSGSYRVQVIPEAVHYLLWKNAQMQTSSCERLTERKALECGIQMAQEIDKGKAREMINVI